MVVGSVAVGSAEGKSDSTTKREGLSDGIIVVTVTVGAVVVTTTVGSIDGMKEVGASVGTDVGVGTSETEGTEGSVQPHVS
jgi:hypothetical protein